MSTKNFVSYGDAETLMTGVKNAISKSSVTSRNFFDYPHAGVGAPCIRAKTNTWTFNTRYKYLFASSIWTDGVNLYHTYQNETSIYNREEHSWTTVKSNDSIYMGSDVWYTDTGIYASGDYSNLHYNLKYNTVTGEWEDVTWIGVDPVGATQHWTDGNYFYYTNNYNTYVLDEPNLTWTAYTFTNNIRYGISVWSDGLNIYSSYGTTSNQFKFNRSTRQWETMSWTGFTTPTVNQCWEYKGNILYNVTHRLKKDSNSWEAITLALPISDFTPQYIWRDGDHIYYDNFNTHYIIY